MFWLFSSFLYVCKGNSSSKVHTAAAYWIRLGLFCVSIVDSLSHSASNRASRSRRSSFVTVSPPEILYADLSQNRRLT